jgi:hypothetical protein
MLLSPVATLQPFRFSKEVVSPREISAQCHTKTYSFRCRSDDDFADLARCDPCLSLIFSIASIKVLRITIAIPIELYPVVQGDTRVA